jgi:hypothetical protein
MQSPIVRDWRGPRNMPSHASARLYRGRAVRAEFHGQIDERSLGPACRAHSVPRIHVALPGGARNIHLNPRRVAELELLGIESPEKM